ncbi:hypothetical protein FHS83_002433 [Rhizomicrobium palustre]|uniref:Uncharacterized protein n=1 Tax=Rhizomicrobium palustre TaxID=189966 RepID=A0A846N0V9_9PROT|nr:hypothetical protein [Rhizomicrobium palustre]NIK89115.1 hypothetical protein [Rhizomicrobium palustre]
MIYEVVFKDHGGKIYSKSTLEAADDEAAIALARRIHRSGVGHGYDIVKDGTVIHSETFGSKPTKPKE